MKNKIATIFTVIMLIGSASAYAMESGWYWTNDLKVARFMMERTNDDRLMCRVVTTSSHSGNNEWVFEVYEETEAMVEAVNQALIHGRSINLRWKTDGSRKIGYEYRHGGGTARINETVAITLR